MATKPEMPSQVMDKNIIQAPEGNVVDSDEEWDSCGKWMLYHPRGDPGFLDAAWTALQRLLEDGTLIMIKATTGLVTDSGVSIYCFTRPGKREARRAAAAIRALVYLEGIMYYRLNGSHQGTGNRCEDRRFTIYMQTLRGGFYTKKNGVWLKDNDDAHENIVPIASQFFKENYSGNENLPSTCEEHCFLMSPENHQCEKTDGCSNWYLFCSREDEGPYLSEVDRVWLVAKQLLEEGSFAGLTCRKLEYARCAEVRLYVSGDCGVRSRLAACDRIFGEASCRTVMYFVDAASRTGHNPPERQQKKLVYDYKYTPDGELYRISKYGEQYIFA